MCAQLLSGIQLFVTPWTVAHQEGVSISSSWVSSRSKDQTFISCIRRQIFYQWATWEAQMILLSLDILRVQSI